MNSFREFVSGRRDGFTLIVLADGSVRTLSYAIDPTTFSYLGNIKDGHAIDLSNF